MWRGLVLSLILLPLTVRADVLTYVISPDSNPAHGLSCRIELVRGQIIAVEALGIGMPPRHALRWPAGRVEQAAIRKGLGAFLTGDLPSLNGTFTGEPPSPYVTVIWATQLNGAPISGLYFQKELHLPPQLSDVLQTVLPDSACTAKIR